MTVFTHALSTNNYGESKFIVSATASLGTHTTIAAALAVATSGDTIFIRDGSYTENLTMVPGVILTAVSGSSTCAAVTITGKMTFTTAGNYCISNVKLVTNSDFIISCTGANAVGVFLTACALTGSNNTIVNFTNSNAASTIAFDKCAADVSTTGITHFTSSSVGSISYTYSSLGNSGNSTTASTISAGSLGLYWSILAIPISSSGTTATLNSYYCDYNNNAINTAVITWGSTAAGSSIRDAYLGAGSASAVSISASCSLILNFCEINSSNTNAITGAGTLSRGALTFVGSSSTINTTTVTQLKELPKVAPTVQTFTSGTAATYTTPANTQWIRIRMVGGGGGGGGSGTTPGSGTSGTASTFSGGTLSAGGGTGVTALNSGGAGGTSSGGSILNLTGNTGTSRPTNAVATYGGAGGASMFGGRGSGGDNAPSAGGAAVANSGSGGGGGGSNLTAFAGSGGGAGGFVEHIINSPAATYTYTVGAAGTGGTLGTSGAAGGNGAAGYIIVEEYYL